MTHVPRLCILPLAVFAGLALTACGSSATSTPSSQPNGPRPSNRQRAHQIAVRRTRPPAVTPTYPRLLGAGTSSSPTNFVPAVSWGGRTAVWVARRPGLALLSFNQRLAELRLHSGTVDAGAAGWRYGPAIVGLERRRLIAAFNGGFKLDTAAGGFESDGRVGYPLSAGLGSIVTYSDGSTDIGVWHRALPAAGKHVVSVRQNLHLMIDGGRPAPDLGCLLCWGATLGGVIDPARSGLGITADGRLVWVGGENLTAEALAAALLGAHVVRAVELDINPEWVAGYLYDTAAARDRSRPFRSCPASRECRGSS
jgi:hypothetical protein